MKPWRYAPWLIFFSINSVPLAPFRKGGLSGQLSVPGAAAGSFCPQSIGGKNWGQNRHRCKPPLSIQPREYEDSDGDKRAMLASIRVQTPILDPAFLV